MAGETIVAWIDATDDSNAGEMSCGESRTIAASESSNEQSEISANAAEAMMGERLMPAEQATSVGKPPAKSEHKPAIAVRIICGEFDPSS